MKKLCLLPALLLFALANAHAATNYVLVGQALQPAIDASLPGDTLVMQAGVYPDSPNFNKPLTVLRNGTNQIQIVGAVQMTGAGDRYFSQCQFSSAVNIQCTGVVSFVQSQFLAPLTSTNATLLLSGVTGSSSVGVNLTSGNNTNFHAYDSTFNGATTVTGGKTLMKRTGLNALTLSSNASFEGLRITNLSLNTITATAAPGSGATFVAVQSKVYYLNTTGYKVWLGYNHNHSGGTWYTLTDCETVMMGNVIGNYVNTVTRGTLKAYNNRFYFGTSMGGYPLIQLNSTTAEVMNNTIYGVTANGIQVTGTGSAIIRANIIFVSAFPGISTTGPSLDVSYCCVYTPGASPFSGFSAAPNSIFVNPSLTPDPIFALNPSSQCINAGPPEAIYNDRDGSRNDMGYTGGPYWNPANYTNDNPMVFFLTGSPQIVFKGAQTNLQINVGASAGH